MCIDRAYICKSFSIHHQPFAYMYIYVYITCTVYTRMVVENHRKGAMDLLLSLNKYSIGICGMKSLQSNWGTMKCGIPLLWTFEHRGCYDWAGCTCTTVFAHTLVVMTWQEYHCIMHCFSDVMSWQMHDVTMHIISSK